MKSEPEAKPPRKEGQGIASGTAASTGGSREGNAGHLSDEQGALGNR